ILLVVTLWFSKRLVPSSPLVHKIPIIFTCIVLSIFNFNSFAHTSIGITLASRGINGDEYCADKYLSYITSLAEKNKIDMASIHGDLFAQLIGSEAFRIQSLNIRNDSSAISLAANRAKKMLEKSSI